MHPCSLRAMRHDWCVGDSVACAQALIWQCCAGPPCVAGAIPKLLHAKHVCDAVSVLFCRLIRLGADDGGGPACAADAGGRERHRCARAGGAGGRRASAAGLPGALCLIWLASAGMQVLVCRAGWVRTWQPLMPARCSASSGRQQDLHLGHLLLGRTSAWNYGHTGPALGTPFVGRLSACSCVHLQDLHCCAEIH